MISSASAQIEATGGDHLKTTIIKDGKSTIVPDYARVQGILIGVVSVYIIFLAIIGPECVVPLLLLASTATLSFELMFDVYIGTTDRTLSNKASPFRRTHMRMLVKSWMTRSRAMCGRKITTEGLKTFSRPPTPAETQ